MKLLDIPDPPTYKPMSVLTIPPWIHRSPNVCMGSSYRIYTIAIWPTAKCNKMHPVSLLKFSYYTPKVNVRLNYKVRSALHAVTS